MATITKNSEILFIYDAKMSNPNGDMDNENKPRMDYDTGRNIVSDVRFKRYLRDYFETNLGMEIFITEKAEKAEKRVESLLSNEEKKLMNSKSTPAEKRNEIIRTSISSKLIDVRLFGAVFATSGGNDHLTGPIQFNWGYSLNQVELSDSNTITSSFSSGEGIGKDYRVKYSLLAFDATVNAKVAENTGLSEEDMTLFDEAMVKAIPLCKTRSKQGQTPRLYIRVELTDNKTVLKDLREYVNIETETEDFKVRGISECKLDLSRLKGYLELMKDKIKTIYLWKDDELKIMGFDGVKTEKFNF